MDWNYFFSLCVLFLSRNHCAGNVWKLTVNSLSFTGKVFDADFSLHSASFCSDSISLDVCNDWLLQTNLLKFLHVETPAVVSGFSGSGFDSGPISLFSLPVPMCNDEEDAGFTGKRFNSKMVVYSGSKTSYLPRMMTLYEQCIRVLQNNIDCEFCSSRSEPEAAAAF